VAPRTLLIADDDSHLREIVRYALTDAGFTVLEAANGREALEKAKAERPALLLLDIMMPELDGLEVCRQVRATMSIPVVFVSSRDDELDRILGLELGGDDYISKPFSPRELVARVKAVLRRAYPESPPSQEAPKTLQRGPLRVELDSWRAFWDGQEVVLTVTELNLLIAFMRAPGKAFTRDQLMDHAWENTVVSDRTVDSHIRRIRQKFAAAGGAPIETVHGHGYRLTLG